MFPCRFFCSYGNCFFLFCLLFFIRIDFSVLCLLFFIRFDFSFLGLLSFICIAFSFLCLLFVPFPDSTAGAFLFPFIRLLCSTFFLILIGRGCIWLFLFKQKIRISSCKCFDYNGVVFTHQKFTKTERFEHIIFNLPNYSGAFFQSPLVCN